MKFTEILKTIILETAKFTALYDKYVKPGKEQDKGRLHFVTFKRLIFADPNTRAPQNFDIEGASIDDMKDVHPGKYSDWLIKRYLGDKYKSAEGYDVDHPFYREEFREFQRLFAEDTDRIKNLLSKYDRFKGSLKEKNKKDINNVHSIEELANLQVVVGDSGETVDLETYRGKKVKKEKGKESNKNFVFPGSEILKVGTDYTLVRISDKGELGSKAASFFGGYHNVDRGETNWCTSPQNSSYSENYRKQGPLYIFLANDDKGQVGEVTGLPTERYQIHFPSDQYKDRRNQTIDFEEELSTGKFSEFKEHFKTEFAKNLTTTDGREFKISSFQRGSTGRFIRIYGLEEIFESIPTSIEKFVIQNPENIDVKINLPERIGDFKNLDLLTCDNCISNVPDSICELKSLQFLNLTNNSSLTNIPECLIDLPNLEFLNLNGSNNLNVSSRINEKAIEVRKNIWHFSTSDDDD